MISILHDEKVRYPEPEEGFSPDARCPEYRYDHVSRLPNPVYAMVRSLFSQAGFDAENLGSTSWNPLARHVRRGSRVFVLCNFVYHRRPQETVESFRAKCIHGSVLRALIDYLLLAAGPEGRIAFGNAPLQSCNWSRVLEETGARSVADFYAASGVAVIPRDLRLYVAERNALGSVTRIERRGNGTDAVEVDLKNESLLAEIGGGDGSVRFRVSDYDRRRTEAFHAGGAHRYVIHREVLEADVIVSICKLKTHEKVGVTCGLKGFVGAVAHKDCLAHHRFGGRSSGGDEYPYDWSLLNGYSHYHDWVNSRDGGDTFQGALQIVDRVVRRGLRRAGIPAAGAWHGNDTCWRMALDLSRILHYADRSGSMTEQPQRTHLSLIDGIVGGEGNGPLAPAPVSSGILLFADNVALGDRIACRLMGYDPNSLPLVQHACLPSKYSLVPADGAEEILFNGERVNETGIPAVLGRRFRPPSGWRRYFQAR